MGIIGSTRPSRPDGGCDVGGGRSAPRAAIKDRSFVITTRAVNTEGGSRFLCVWSDIVTFDPEEDTVPDLGTDGEIRRKEIVDTYDVAALTDHPVFADAAETVAAIAGTDQGYVALMDDDTQWMVGFIGDFSRRVERRYTLCNHTVAEGQPIIVEDARVDERFGGLPIVVDDQKVVFYAGIPLVVDGVAVGTLCATAPEPKAMEDARRAEMLSVSRHIERFLATCVRYPEGARPREIVAGVARSALGAVYSRWQQIPASVDRKMLSVEKQADAVYNQLVEDEELPEAYQFSEIGDVGSS